MVKPRRNDFLIPLMMTVADYLAIVASFYCSYLIRFNEPFVAYFPVTKGVPPAHEYLLGALIVAPLWMILFNSRKIYRARRDIDLSAEFSEIVKRVTMGMLIVMSLAFFYRTFSFSRLVFVLLWSTSIPLLFLGRYFVFRYEKYLYKRGRELRNVLLVGTNKVAQSIAVQLTQRPSLGFRLVGFISDDHERIESVEVTRMGAIEDLPRLIQEHKIETLIVCMTEERNSQFSQILDLLVGTSVQILLQFEVVGIMPTRLRTYDLFGLPFLGVKDIPMTTWGRIAKRAFDVAFSLMVIVFSAPLFCLIWVLVWIESGKPVFFTQVRIGMHGEHFNLYKFRTMRKDAEKETGPTWTRKGDPRVTRIGKILRRTSLDELPQFLNVLKGEMSVVGPRPERPEFVTQFQEYVPKYLERHRLKTGLTGWAQVSGLRGEVPISERTKYDLYYIENWSFGFDLRIILKTLYTIIFGKDAY